MAALVTELRTRLEHSVKEARRVAESGARQALEALAVPLAAPHSSMTAEQKLQRNKLRAHGRQLGDRRDAKRGTQEVERLVREVAYEHWHRMLFARFLAENHLLIEPKHKVPISMEECEDIARERGEDPWALAASFAQGMLPQIFRSDDPALAVTLAPETRQSLQRLLADLPRAVFTEGDSLGWTYQFWQAAEKGAVNERVKSGEKITGETLPAVTQLFTEPYMVQFLLHNTIGAWYAGRVLSPDLLEKASSEQELRDAARLTPAGGYEFEYLRFVRESEGEGGDAESSGSWRPAAGTFEGWPKTTQELTVLDPCCGSGHFVVEAFELLVRLRMQVEELDLPAAVRAVIGENLYALELDARCTQIAAFNLALAAWKLVGEPIQLPPMRIACSGVGPQASREEWLAMAEDAAAVGGMPMERDLLGGDETLLSAGVKGGLEALYDLFEKAPELGSLIDPTSSSADGSQFDSLRADFSELTPLLNAILETEGANDEERERVVAARGMAEAARILVGPAGGYTLVVTNVPYLGRGSHTDAFKSWADSHHKEAKNDLATVFVSRMLRWVRKDGRSGTIAAVTPQNWLFLSSYEGFRRRLLAGTDWNCAALLGSNAFRDMNWWAATTALLILSGASAHSRSDFVGFDVGGDKDIKSKANFLSGSKRLGIGMSDGFGGGGLAGPLVLLREDQLKNPDARIVLRVPSTLPLLRDYADAHQGLITGDVDRFRRSVWEFMHDDGSWPFLQSTVNSTQPWGGRSFRVLRETESWARSQGMAAWGRNGIAVSQMRSLPVSLYDGALFDNNMSPIVPRDPAILAPIWAFCSSDEFAMAIRGIDQKVNVTNATLVKVPFDLGHWQKVAEEAYPNGLPEPYSSDPSQWLFHGHPAHAEPGTELQVAVARFLGYRWPAELDSEMSLSNEARALIQRSRELDALGLTDKDGIVCLSPIRGEPSAADRLRDLLASAFGMDWSGAKERELLASAAESGNGTGKRAASLDDWLRASFFEEHCKLFHHCPFVWHIWDGLEDGFNVLVNYHRLAGADGMGRRTLESLTFTYLGEWIERHRSAQKSGAEGTDARLAAALRLQEQLQKVLEGEPPYDLFVRWKPLHEQPLGWEPDLNDGVRLNVRPFLLAEDVGRKGAGILRWKPNVTWGKDRGKEPESLRPREDFPWFWGCNPEKNAAHETDFGAGTPASAPAGTECDGARWNSLHYTRAARQGARERAARGANR